MIAYFLGHGIDKQNRKFSKIEMDLSVFHWIKTYRDVCSAYGEMKVGNGEW